MPTGVFGHPPEITSSRPKRTLTGNGTGWAALTFSVTDAGSGSRVPGTFDSTRGPVDDAPHDPADRGAHQDVRGGPPTPARPRGARPDADGRRGRDLRV